VTSLRARLFLAIASLLIIVGVLSGALVYHWAFDEALELQDAALAQIGLVLSETRVRSNPSLPEVQQDTRILVAELTDPVGQTDSARLVKLPKDVADGLQTRTIDGETWRLLVRTRADGSRVAIGQPVLGRNEIARGSALGAALPFALLIPCLMALVAVMIQSSFLPVSRLTDRLEQDESVTLQALPVAGIPDEMAPFVRAINRLIARLAKLLDRERRFIADAAHELRTPIAALGVQAENLERAATESDRTARSAELMTGIRRTAHLLEQLLDHARYAGDAKRVNQAIDISRVARTVVADFLPLAARRSIDLGFTRSEHAPAQVDESAAATVVRNLVANALQHAPNGGRVDIGVITSATEAILEVEDNGPGVPPEDLERIVDPFMRGQNPRGEGTGLGLSIVNRIAHAAAGRLVLENRDGAAGSGLRARVTFPLPSRHNVHVSEPVGVEAQIPGRTDSYVCGSVNGSSAAGP
jgi:two-component system OmpR family sensor kinase